MEAKEQIEHEGIVSRIKDKSLYINLLVTSACGACDAKGYCGMSESAVKEIEIHGAKGMVKPGDHVVVCLSKSNGFLALFLGYLLPFIIMIMALLLTLQTTQNETLSGLISLGVLIPYYAILFLSRGALKRKFTFTLKSEN